MLQGFRAQISAWRKNNAVKRSAEAHEPAFYNARSTTDTVVFVHGLAGHYSKTWKRFPELLHLDIDLPRTDILLWGFRSTLLPTDSSVRTEAKRLMSDMRVVLPNAEHIFFVGHSMGGLTILEGLVDELREGRAEKLPVSVARHVALYATPALGTELASVLKLTVGVIPRIKYAVSRQVRDLSAGDFVGTLTREVVNRIYKPTVAPGEVASKRKISITACVGTRDLAVSQTSARSVFNENPPVILDADHFDIKEPSSRKDRRYLALKNILAEHYGRWFTEVAAQCLGGPASKRAAALLFTRCEHALEARLAARTDLGFANKDAAGQRALKLRLLREAVELSRDMPNEPLERVLNAALAGV